MKSNNKQPGKKEEPKIDEKIEPIPTPAATVSSNEVPVSDSLGNEIPSPSFNPLAEVVNEKSYSGAGADGKTVYSDIPEHNYQPPPDEFNDIPEKEFTNKEKKAQEKPKVTGNPDMQFASEKEKHDGAEAMTDVLLTTWDQLYKGANQLFKISEKTVSKLQQSGAIDTRVEVPYKMNYAPLSKVFQDYNNDAEGLLVVEEDFKKEIHPLITEELAKAGHGMSNKQKLIYLLSTKVLADGFKAFQFISLKKDYLRFAKEATDNGRKAGMVVPPEPVTHIQESLNETDQEEYIVNDNNEDVYEPPMTLQEQALAKHVPGGVNNSANFGSKKGLSRLNKEAAKDRVIAKGKKAKAKQHIAKAKTAVQHDPPPDGKRKGRGRPPGAKNKKK